MSVVFFCLFFLSRERFTYTLHAHEQNTEDVLYNHCQFRANRVYNFVARQSPIYLRRVVSVN